MLYMYYFCRHLEMANRWVCGGSSVLDDPTQQLHYAGVCDTEAKNKETQRLEIIMTKQALYSPLGISGALRL